MSRTNNTELGRARDNGCALCMQLLLLLHPTSPLCVYVREYGMWYARGYVLGEEGVNASTSRGRNSKLEG